MNGKPEHQSLPILGERELDEKTNDTLYYKVKGFKLTNHKDQPTSDRTFATEKISVINFFFTRCPSICPILINNMQKVSTAFVTENIISLHSVSIDPSYDNTKRLKAYVQKYHINELQWNFYGGNKNDILNLAKNCKLKAFEEDSGDLVHEPHIVLLDSHKRIRGYYDGLDKNSIEILIGDIKKLTVEEKMPL